MEKVGVPKNKPPVSASMDAKQIMDVLPSYISLYKNPSPNPNPNPNPEKSTILKWFSTLSPPQRLAHLTIVDPTFTQLLLRMLSSPLHTTFFILPDLPSPDSLPTLCTRRSRGLLSRLAESDHSAQLLRSSTLLFSSTDSSQLDTLTFRETFVFHSSLFVSTLDNLSNSGFLTGSTQDWAELGKDWPELGWFKAKGYYSLEAFVANRLEIALRLAWVNHINTNGGAKKIRGVTMKLKEKAKNAVGLGVNVYWRKIGCVNWWEKLDDGVKKKVIKMVLGRAAKFLVCVRTLLFNNFMLDLITTLCVYTTLCVL